jgi:hypothetical protein
LTFNGLHGVIFQKIVLFINIAVRTSYPTILGIVETRLIFIVTPHIFICPLADACQVTPS